MFESDKQIEIVTTGFASAVAVLAKGMPEGNEWRLLRAKGSEH
jgi:hypothetical protein